MQLFPQKYTANNQIRYCDDGHCPPQIQWSSYCVLDLAAQIYHNLLLYYWKLDFLPLQILSSHYGYRRHHLHRCCCYYQKLMSCHYLSHFLEKTGLHLQIDHLHNFYNDCHHRHLLRLHHHLPHIHYRYPHCLQHLWLLDKIFIVIWW